MQYIAAPIAGDRVYGKKKADRLYLHAHTLQIMIPATSTETFTAPIPKEFTKSFPEHDNA
jgi:23S rRNA-/tRNA-specific pseudouridylate synthase